MASPVTVLWVDKYDKYYCRECNDFIRPESCRDRHDSQYVHDLDKAYDHVMEAHRANAMMVRKVRKFPRPPVKRLADVLGGDAADAEEGEGRR